MNTKLPFVVVLLSILFFIANEGYACVPCFPVAILTADPICADVNETIIFDGNDSYDTDEGGFCITKYEWDWTSDGIYDYNETSSYYPDGAFDGNTTHAYSTEGIYLITMRVTDDESYTKTTPCQVFVGRDPNRVHNITQNKWYSLIQLAINEANYADVVEVNEGTYPEVIDFNGRSITLRSTDPNNWDTVAATVINACSIGSVVTFAGTEDANCLLTGFTITGGSTSTYGHGGGIHGKFTLAGISRCIIRDNSAGLGGGISGCNNIIDRCIIAGNSANVAGGGIDGNCANATPDITNCLIYDNSAYYGGGIVGCDGNITNCTIVSNDTATPGYGGVMSCNGAITNCIIWGNQYNQLAGSSDPNYSCIEGWTGGGTGNISSNPLFFDANNDNYYLKSYSPCINAGDPNSDANVIGPKDLDNRPRIIENRIDMGAYEYDTNIYVDVNATGKGDGSSWTNAFNNIQDAIDAAGNGDEIWVRKGTYTLSSQISVNKTIGIYGGFDGDETQRSERDWSANVTTINGNDAVRCFEVTAGATIDGFTITDGNGGNGGGFYCSADANIFSCVIANSSGGGVYCDGVDPCIINCVIRDGNSGIRCNGSGAQPRIINNTVVQNLNYGVYCANSASPVIKNCIVWDNSDDLYGCSATYSCIMDGDAGTGNIKNDPYFADSGNNDFHLKSAEGRWNGSGWTNDSVTSLCINGGDPSSAYSNEPTPNGGRINMGAYGDTNEASKSAKYHLAVYLVADDSAALSGDCKWQLYGYDSNWRNSGYAILVPAGNNTIKCQCNFTTYYISPSNLGITIGSGQPVSYTRTYNACGYINYVPMYDDDFGDYVTTGTGWRVVGEGSWRGAGAQDKFLPGNYTVEFKSVAEHKPPSNRQVTVTKGSSNSDYIQYHTRSTFYVDVDSGSDSDKGGSLNPYLTIQKGFNAVPSSGWIYVKSNYSTIYEDITFPSSSRSCTIQSQSGNITVRGDHTPDTCPGWITRIGVTFQEW